MTVGGGFFTGRYRSLEDPNAASDPGSRFDPNTWQGKMYRERYWNAPYFNALAKIEAVFSNYLVIYSGTPGSSLHARQPSTTSATFDVNAPASPSGGILKRYQLLTPGLIIVLLVKPTGILGRQVQEKV